MLAKLIKNAKYSLFTLTESEGAYTSISMQTESIRDLGSMLSFQEVSVNIKEYKTPLQDHPRFTCRLPNLPFNWG